ncbi:MAG TPA: anti-sigma factor [Candidatus Limnocylindria bacterium]|nr:anti-sigma factor [Candidatus Limnocylindria bacterium]
MTDVWTDKLSDYLDAELTAGQRAELETHLATCAECRAALAELRRVVAHARVLENPPAPAYLWPRIAERLAARPRGAGIFAWPWRLPRVVQIPVPRLVAAGVTLMLLSGGAMWFALQRPAFQSRLRVGGTPVTEAPGRVATQALDAFGTSDAPAASAALAVSENPGYDATIAELEGILAAGRGTLDTSTVRVLEQSLATIDRAVEQARRAVAADPANPYLRSHLAATMMRKVDFLRRATVLAGDRG